MPAYLGEYEKELRPFVDAMRVKLAANQHKGKGERLNLDDVLQKLHGEIEELREAIKRGNTIEMLLESADLANYAMIAFNIALNKAVNGDASRDDGPLFKPLHVLDPAPTVEISDAFGLNRPDCRR